MEDLKEKFGELVKKWGDHEEKNSHMSDIESYLNCDAFRELAKMGSKILPFIREEYAKPQDDQDMRNPGMHWCYLIKAIEPSFRLRVGEKGSGSAVEKVAPGFVGIDIHKVREATLKWLDKYLAKQKKG